MAGKELKFITSLSEHKVDFSRIQSYPAFTCQTVKAARALTLNSRNYRLYRNENLAIFYILTMAKTFEELFTLR